MEELNHIWDVNEHIAPLEIIARFVIMFFITLILIRISGVRSFSKASAFDTIITLLLGAILSRVLSALRLSSQQ